jgi:DNA-binding NarL/FixJ family response regulator
MPITVLLTDDHEMMREGLRRILESEADIQVAGEAAGGRQAVALARQLNPDVIILDISMPDLNGVDAARQIAARRPRTRIVALSMHRDQRLAEEMLRAGARGYCLKDGASAELVAAIRAVMEGHTYLTPAVADVVIEDFVSHSAADGTAGHKALTGREREVLQLLAEGHGTKSIASRLHVSPSTVDTHRQHIMGKLALHSIAELTKYAIRERLTSVDD